jgi:hypothetical protein
MRQTLLPACLLVFLACPAVRADFPGPDCCSTYPIYLCPPGFLSYPAPPRALAPFENCGGCCNGDDSAWSCGVITPNPYTCCFYGVTLSNYGLITPLRSMPGTVPSRLPVLPPAVPAEALPKPAPR